MGFGSTSGFGFILLKNSENHLLTISQIRNDNGYLLQASWMPHTGVVSDDETGKSSEPPEDVERRRSQRRSGGDRRTQDSPPPGRIERRRGERRKGERRKTNGEPEQ